MYRLLHNRHLIMGTVRARFYLSKVHYSNGDNPSACFSEPKWNYSVSERQHGPYRDTSDNSHQALSVYQLCAAFVLKEAVPGLLVTHICAELDFHSWPGRDPLPSLFISPSVQGLGKKCLIEACSTFLVKHSSSTPPLDPFPLSASAALGLNNFYSGTLLVCCRERRRNFLVRFCPMITGFPVPPLPCR